MTDKSARIDFLHVHWFVRASDEFGDESFSLERIKFAADEDGISPYGLVDPKIVVRAVHLVPAFSFSEDRAKRHKHFFVNRSVRGSLPN